MDHIHQSNKVGGTVLAFPRQRSYIRAAAGVMSPRNVSWASVSLYKLDNSEPNPGSHAGTSELSILKRKTVICEAGEEGLLRVLQVY